MATMELVLNGGSDDLIEVEGLASGATEFDWMGGEPWQGELRGPDGQRLGVMLWYSSGGTWFAGVGQTAEGEPLPDWPVRFDLEPQRAGAPGYITRLHVTCPRGTVLIDQDEKVWR